MDETETTKEVVAEHTAEDEVIETSIDQRLAAIEAGIAAIMARLESVEGREQVEMTDELKLLCEAVKEETSRDVEPSNSHWLYRRVGRRED